MSALFSRNKKMWKLRNKFKIRVRGRYRIKSICEVNNAVRFIANASNLIAMALIMGMIDNNRQQAAKAGESQGRAPGQASDYTLRAPNPLDSCTHNQTFYQDFGPPSQSGPQVFCPPPAPLPLAGPWQAVVQMTEAARLSLMCHHVDVSLRNFTILYRWRFTVVAKSVEIDLSGNCVTTDTVFNLGPP